VILAEWLLNDTPSGARRFARIGGIDRSGLMAFDLHVFARRRPPGEAKGRD
jgi:hypothetical protein